MRGLHSGGVALGLVFSAVMAVRAADRTAPGPDLPQAWEPRWRVPAVEDRPLQIVHGIPTNRASRDGMQYYRDLGLGGIVCNVAFEQYLRSEEHWQTLLRGVEACRQLGLIVWLYDEDGYPSGAAGGRVLAQNRDYEACELTFDASRDEPLVVRPAYEFTHASNNYYAARRYANLIDDRAMGCFIQTTHEAYWRRLESYFGHTIQATFTDEPSLIAINLGQIPEPARSRVRVVDAVDPAAKQLPSVPWCYDLPDRYRERYGQDILAHRRSLFAGDSAADRQVRRQFWELIAELIADRYFGALQKWCTAHRVASSGHTLHEESILHQVALNGNSLKVLCKMDIPGLDLLTSDPGAVLHSGWLTASLPSSAALLTGGRRVMTEVSDFSFRMSGRAPADLSEMQATAAWQAAWGVTEFTLYYSPHDRPTDTYRAYCEYVGRLNAVLKPARMDRRVLLYYPIRDLWTEYLPVAEPLRLESQSARAQQIVGSLMRLGRALQRSQIPFALIDHERLAGAQVSPGGKLVVAGAEFESLVVPEGVEFSEAVAVVVERFCQAGGRVVRDSTSGPTREGRRTEFIPFPDGINSVLLRGKDSLRDVLQPAYRIAPPSDSIALGQFSRDGRQILLLVNVGSEGYQGRLIATQPKTWLLADPAGGSIQPGSAGTSPQIELRLPPRNAVFAVEVQAGRE